MKIEIKRNSVSGLYSLDIKEGSISQSVWLNTRELQTLGKQIRELLSAEKAKQRLTCSAGRPA